MIVCPHLKGKFIIWTHVHTFNMHVHKLKYRSLEYGFLQKNQELPKSDSIKDFNLEGSLWLSSIQQQKPLLYHRLNSSPMPEYHLWNFNAFINKDFEEM
jgi:hypothetical protein